MKSDLAVFLFLLLEPCTTFATGSMLYTVDLRDASKHLAHITLEPKGYTSAAIEFQMPVWAPGAYGVTHYGRFLRNVSAVDMKGAPLAVTQLGEDRWRVSDARNIKAISYDVLDSHADSTSLYYALAAFDSDLVFANATAYFGYVNDE